MSTPFSQAARESRVVLLRRVFSAAAHQRRGGSASGAHLSLPVFLVPGVTLFFLHAYSQGSRTRAGGLSIFEVAPKNRKNPPAFGFVPKQTPQKKAPLFPLARRTFRVDPRLIFFSICSLPPLGGVLIELFEFWGEIVQKRL